MSGNTVPNLQPLESQNPGPRTGQVASIPGLPISPLFSPPNASYPLINLLIGRRPSPLRKEGSQRGCLAFQTSKRPGKRRPTGIRKHRECAGLGGRRRGLPGRWRRDRRQVGMPAPVVGSGLWRRPTAALGSSEGLFERVLEEFRGVARPDVSVYKLAFLYPAVGLSPCCV